MEWCLLRRGLNVNQYVPVIDQDKYDQVDILQVAYERIHECIDTLAGLHPAVVKRYIVNATSGQIASFFKDMLAIANTYGCFAADPRPAPERVLDLAVKEVTQVGYGDQLPPDLRLTAE